ncbi:MAG: chorismate synthase, partial [Chloroflexota bacterium]
MIRFLTAGESHGPCLTVIIEGFPSGLEIDMETINRDLARRQRGYGRNKRMQIEQDRAENLGGIINGHSIGAPIVMRIENLDWVNWQERWAKGDLEPLVVPRPGHADYAGMVKYGFDDVRPVLERASARETAARVVAGTLAKHLLTQFNINIGSYVTEIGGVAAPIQNMPMQDRFTFAEQSEVRCPDDK